MKTKLVPLLWLLLPVLQQAARAQTTLVASMIAGGGGENGTVGQWNVKPMTQGAEAIISGFWNTQELPWLRIERTGGSLLIAWPSSFAGLQLERSARIGSDAVWESVSQSINVANGENQITLSIGPNMQFFRLHKP